MTAIYTAIENFFRYWDIFSEQPKMRVNGRSRFTSCCGLLLTLAFIATSIAVVAPVLRDYIDGKYVEQVIKIDLANQNGELGQQLVTGRDIFMAVTVRQRNSTRQVDIGDALKSYMVMNLGTVDTKSSTSLQLLSTQPCPPGYMSTFDNYVPMTHCYKPVDKLKLKLSSVDKYMHLRFDSLCRLGLLCSGSIISAAENIFNSFWFQHTFTFYFTTRYLDRNNQVRFRIHMVSSKQFYESSTSSNIVVGYLTTTDYYIDDSVLPTRNNKTIRLEDYYDKLLPSVVTESAMSSYGVGVILAQVSQQKIVYRYYSKLDLVVSVIGSCVFLLFVMYACLGYRINRYIYRQYIVESQYLQIQDGVVQPAQLNICEQLCFLPYRLFKKVPNEQGNLSKMENYYRSYYMATHNYTDIIEIVKKLNSIRRNLVRMGRTNWKDYLKKYRMVKYDQGREAVKPKEQKMIDLQGWSANQFNDYENLQPDVRQLYVDSEDSMRAIQNPSELTSGYNKLPNKEQLSYAQKFGKVLKKIDAFKVYPRFRINFDSRSRLVGLCCLIFFTLSILLWVTAFGFFVRSDSRVSIEQITMSVNDVNYTVKTGKPFMAALCVMDTSGFSRDFDVQFNSYAAIQLVQHSRVGTIKTEQTYKMNALRQNFQSEFEGVSSLPDYIGNCYGIPRNVELTMQGSPVTETEKYFSIRIRQACPNTDPIYCENYYLANRANTLSIYSANTIRVLITDNKFDAVSQTYESNYANILAFKNRATTCNSSVIDVTQVDQSVFYDDRSIHRDGGKEIHSSISSQWVYVASSEVLPPEKSVFYQMNFRSSGKVLKTSLVSPKGDEIFSMIGGVLLFVFFILGIFARPYREYNQRMHVAMMTDAVRSNQKPNIFQMFMYFTCFHGFIDWFKCKAPCMMLSRVFSSLSSDSQSIENVAKSTTTLHRLTAAAMKKENSNYNLSQVYIKHQPQQENVSGAAISNEHGLEESLQPNLQQGLIEPEQVSSDINPDLPVEEDPGVVRKGRKKRKSSKLGESQTTNKDVEESIEMGKQKSFVQLIDSTNQLQDIIPASTRKPAMEDMSQQNGSRSHSKVKTVVPKSKFCQMLFGPQNFLTNFLDFFGVQGELTINGEARYGSVFGGILTIITAAFIIGTCYAFSDVYTGKYNYFSTRTYQTQSSSTSTDVFVTGKDIRFAIAFTSGNTPGLQDVDQNVSGSTPIMKLILVEAQVNNTDRDNSVYSEVVHTLEKCPSDYLNDGKLFQYVPYSSNENISNAYCPPEGLSLTLQGNLDTQIQKWFYVSIAMICPGCNSTQLSSRRVEFANFFVNRTARIYISDPIIDEGPLRFDFARMYFGRIVSTRTSIDNISINTADIIQDKYLWEKPTVRKSMDFEYYGGFEYTYNYVDSLNIARNLTFSATYSKSLYVKTYIKFYQILGMIGGFSAFVWLTFRSCGRRHNQGLMYMEIARSLYVEISQASIGSAQQKSFNNYEAINYSEWDVLKYHTFGFFFDGIFSCTACRTSRNYALFKKTFNSIQGELDLVNNLKTINFAQHVLSKQVFNIDGRLTNLNVKEIILPVKQLKPSTKLNDEQLTKLRKFAELHQLTDHQLQKLAQSLGSVGVRGFQEQLGQPAEVLDQINMGLLVNKGRHRGQLEHIDHHPHIMNE